MLEVAKNKNNDKKIDYRCIAMEDLSFSKNIFNHAQDSTSVFVRYANILSKRR